MRIRRHCLLGMLAAATACYRSSAFRPPDTVFRGRRRSYHQTSLRRHQSVSSGTQLWAKAKTGGILIESMESFEDRVLNPTVSRPVLVFYTAPWCAPCRLQVQGVQDVIKQYDEHVNIVEVCTDDVPEIPADHGVVSIPTIQLYVKGELVETIVGLVAKNVLRASIEKILDDVRIQRGDDNTSSSNAVAPLIQPPPPPTSEHSTGEATT